MYSTTTTAEYEENPIELIYLYPGPDYVNNVNYTGIGCPHQPAWKESIDTTESIESTESTETTESETTESTEPTDSVETDYYELTMSLPEGFEVSRQSKKLDIIINRDSPNSQFWDNKFPPLLFYHFCYLESLIIPYSELKYIEAEDFAYANNLLSLNLSHNIFERIESFTFVNMNLKDIDLSYNRIESIDEGAIQLDRLEYLFLQSNRLKTLKINNYVLATLEDSKEMIH